MMGILVKIWERMKRGLRIFNLILRLKKVVDVYSKVFYCRENCRIQRRIYNSVKIYVGAFLRK